MGNTRFIRNTLYKFKRDYGTDLRYIMIEHSEFQTDSGERKLTKQVFYFTAILLPTTLLRKFVQDIGYLAADKNFTYGALNDYASTSFVIMEEDFPDGLKPDLNGYVIHDEQRFEKVQIVALEHGVGHLLLAKTVKGSLPYDVQTEVCQNQLQLSHMVKYELN